MPGEEISYSVKLDLDRLSTDVSRMRHMVEHAGAGLAGAAVNVVAGGIAATSAGRTFNEGASYAAAGQGAGIGGAIGGVAGGLIGGPVGGMIGRSIGIEIGRAVGEEVRKKLDEDRRAEEQRKATVAEHDTSLARGTTSSPEANLLRQLAAAGGRVSEARETAMLERALTRAVRVERAENRIQARAEGLVQIRNMHLQGR